MAEESVVGTYATIDEAESAVKKLVDSKFPADHISIIAQNLHSENKVHGFVTACDVSKKAATTGAWLGGLFGVLVGAAFLWLPGVGPVVVAGSLASVLLGGVEGAVAGSALNGVLGLLVGYGISKEHILKYETSVKAGDYLVIAHGDGAQVASAKSVLNGTKPKQLDVHAA